MRCLKENKFQRILQAHLKAAQTNAKPKLFIELANPTQDKKKF
jgi:hypothetical protein